MTSHFNKREFKCFDRKEDSPGWDLFLDNLHSYWACPEDAKVLMEHFCWCVEHNQEIPKPILGYLQDAFAEFLYDNKTLEASFKLRKKPGRPKAPSPDIYPGPDYVSWILEKIVGGKNKEEALSETLELLNLKDKDKYEFSTIRDHFELYKDRALSEFLYMKSHYEEDLTELEIQQIKKYFPDFSTKN
jgi:hypothetical protein